MIIKNVTVIDGAGGPPQPGRDVHIEDGRFVDIRPARMKTAENSSKATGPAVLDGSGSYLIPGLWESHTHLTGMSMSVPVTDRPAFIHSALTGYVKTGVTSVCELGGPTNAMRRLRAASQANPSTPSLYFAGRSFTGVNGWPLSAVRGTVPNGTGENPGIVPSVEIDSVDSARWLLADQLGEIDYVKCIYDGKNDTGKLPLVALKAMVADAHRANKKVLVHIATGADLRDAVAVGADCIEHSFIPADPADEREAAQIAELLAETGTLYCPTIVTWEQLARTGEPAYLEELATSGILSADDIATVAARTSWGEPFPQHPIAESKIRFDYTMRTLHLFHEAGVKLVAGSDVPLAVTTPALALLRELQLFAMAGIPGSDIITAATSHAATKIGKQGTVGTVTIGAVADAILLDANPLTDIARLTNSRHRRAVIKDGELVLR
ncbi:amidohydrolase family protein [Streptomyces violaceusniger]|uniref:Amidohydrolase n=1 Tax=Streptomyces violaceusniger TaxID=68280 RepID=A0A4D4L251_STRVO|nr:amidohydrolase [Streptomyces violaceusniger]